MDGKKEDFSDWEQVNVKEISSAKKPKIPKKKDNNKNKSEININEINESNPHHIYFLKVIKK